MSAERLLKVLAICQIPKKPEPVPEPPPVKLPPLPCPGPDPLPREQMQPKPPTLTIKTVDDDGHIHTEVLRDKNGEPLRDKSADAPTADKPEPVKEPEVKSTGPPPKWRQPTRAELAARHHQSSGPSYESRPWTNSITPRRGHFNL
jgi:hypothetical protein